MKFEYEKKDDDRECVAFIDDAGDLIVRMGGTGAVWFDRHGGVYNFGEWNDELNRSAAHRFYRGDSITITF